MLKTKKIIYLLILTFIFTTAFSGIGFAKTTSKQQTLTVYSYEAMKSAEYTKAVKDFELANNCKVKVNVILSAKFVQGFMVAANGGEPIDVLVLNGQDTRSFAKKGLIKDISNDITYRNRFNASSLDQYTFGGKLYGVPYGSIDTSGLYINKDVFSKYNLKVPKTYADMVAVNNELKKHDLTLFGFGGGTTYMWPMWYFDIFAQTSGNKSVERTVAALSGKAKFTDPDFVAAMKVLADFGKEGMFQAGFNGADSDGGKAVFTSGKAAAFFGGTWEIPVFRKAGMDASKLDMVPFPIVKAGAKSQQTGSAGSGAVCIYSKIASSQKALALKFVDYLTSEKGYANARKALLTPGSFAYPPTKAVKTNSTDALATTLQKVIMPSTVTFLDWIWAPEITKEFQQDLQAVVGQQMTPEDAMANIQKVYDDIAANGYNFNSTK
jgi:raffinose/stachyose/melibiose transport system substrate-binding protein